MQRVLAIATLTWKAAFRFRLFWVLAVLLLGSVVGLPLLLKDDGTARGFTQILLTYNLSVITTLLGLSTLWLACGTLARDVEDCQIQMVVVKPIARWQVWLGKWLGILMLDAALLLVAGGSVYFLLLWRAQQLPEEQQAILRNEVFVARGSVKERALDPSRLEANVRRVMEERLKEVAVPLEEQGQLETQIREGLLASYQVVNPGYRRFWELDFGLRKGLLRDQPLYIRAKFHVAQTNLSGAYLGKWVLGPTQNQVVMEKSQAADTYHEFEIPPNLIGEDGILRVEFWNQNNTRMLFPLEDGLEVLYREGSFGLNFLRGLAILFCRLALLAAIGLSAASFLSFPVAAFCSLSLLAVMLSTGTLSTVVAEGTVTGVDHETGEGGGMIDYVLIPLVRGILGVVNLVDTFSPVDALSTGRSITWGELGRAVAQIVLLLSGAIGLFGMVCFSRRELASAQGTSG